MNSEPTVNKHLARKDKLLQSYCEGYRNGWRDGYTARQEVELLDCEGVPLKGKGKCA